MSERSLEQSLLTLIDRANEFADRGLALIDGLRPEEMTGATLPDATVWKLHLVATINYRAGLACLRQPETSLGAFTLLRGLLEAWAHLDFIQDNTAGDDARCRALRFERGMSREWANSVRVAPPGFDQAPGGTGTRRMTGSLMISGANSGAAGGNELKARPRRPSPSEAHNRAWAGLTASGALPPPRPTCTASSLPSPIVATAPPTWCGRRQPTGHRG